MSEQWTMPEWMEPYREMIDCSHDFSLEQLMFSGPTGVAFYDKTIHQVRLLERRHKAGVLGPVNVLLEVCEILTSWDPELKHDDQSYSGTVREMQTLLKPAIAYVKNES